MACRVQRTVSTRADALSPPGTPAADPAATGHDDGAPDPDGLPGPDSRDADRTHQLANEPQTDVERTGHQAKVTGQKPKASRRAYAGLIFVPPIVAAGVTVGLFSLFGPESFGQRTSSVPVSGTSSVTMTTCRC